MTGKKRERGANYTPGEKYLFIDLVSKYKHIIDDKSAIGSMLKKKKEAWEIIKDNYNSKCTTGPRHVEQLKALYDNLKQKSRKSSGEIYKTEYIKSQINDVTEDDITKAIKNLKDDKVQIHKTGNDSDAKILAMIQDQIKRLQDPCDSASAYLKSTTEIINVDVDLESTAEAEQDNSTKLETGILEPMEDLYEDLHMASAPTSPIPPMSPIEMDTEASQKKTNKPQSAETLKRIYFKRKVENAQLEKKKLMLEIFNAKREHHLKMIILKKKLEKLNKE